MEVIKGGNSFTEINLYKAKTLFVSHSFYVGGQDVMPVTLAKMLLDDESVEYAKKHAQNGPTPGKKYNIYGAGDDAYLSYFTFAGWLDAVSMYNVRHSAYLTYTDAPERKERAHDTDTHRNRKQTHRVQD